MAQKPFVNPYNFVPLQKESPDRGPVKPGELTGVIRFSLRTRTPLIIPNTSNSDVFKSIDKEEKIVKEHKSYDFFSYDDLTNINNLNEDGTRDGMYSEPVIPGSEIRGMLRNYYEILTNSCMSFVDDDETLSKRTNEVFKPGLIEKSDNGTYILHKAEDCLLRMKNSEDKEIFSADEEPDFSVKSFKNVNIKEGQKVYVDVVERGRKVKPLVNKLFFKDDGKSEIGYIIKGENGPKMKFADKEKHNCHVFIEYGVIRDLNKSEWRTLDSILKIYKENGSSEYNEYRGAWEKFKNGEGEELFPVYYSSVDQNNSFMLSPASITREIYTVKIRSLLREHCSCNEYDNLCPACALFGILGRAFNVTSRIRVADMRLSEKDLERFSKAPEELFEKKICLKPLNSPKINNMEFYVKKPAENAWFWTYEYYVDDGGDVHPYMPEINGRKFYWHQPEMKIEDTETEPDKLNSTVRPLRKDVEFTGEIFFDHINSEELNWLVYTINAGDGDSITEKQHCYKLGHAKPLGFGSVAMQVDSVSVRCATLDDFSAGIDYSVKPYHASIPPINHDIACNFAMMTDFELLRGKDIHYPLPDKPDAEGNYPIFGWFVSNHGGFRHDKGETTGMPNSRVQMTFIEYMKALEPTLKYTGAPRIKKRGIPQKRDNNRTSSKKQNSNPIVEVKVTKILKDGGIVFMDDGKKGMISGRFLNQRKFNTGDMVRVRFKFEMKNKTGDGTVRYYDLAE